MSPFTLRDKLKIVNADKNIYKIRLTFLYDCAII
nr:MAG TPA: hypothetical protein [Caudoviricetes sp.]